MKMPSNSVLEGDCLTVLDSLTPETVDLIYLDPPFFTQKEHGLSTRDGEKYYNFSDKWQDMNEYTSHLTERLKKCKAVLKETGSLFLHCDKTASHYLKVALDSVFGSENFQSEIIWSYRRWSNAKKGLLNNHQTIFFYSKSKNFKFNPKFDDYSPSTNVDQIVQLRERDGRNKAVYKKNEDGSPVLCAEKKGVPLGDVWDIPYLNPKARERVSYPTQKPILLLERIIELVTDAGDLVVDPYCGSGTTLVAAKLLKRHFIGIDKNKDAVSLALSRLANPVKSESNLLKKGRDSYIRSDAQVKESISQLGAILVQRNKGIDGLLSVAGRMVAIKVLSEGTSLQEAAEAVVKASQKNSYPIRAIYELSASDSKTREKIYQQYEVFVFSRADELTDQIARKAKLRKSSALKSQSIPAEV
ncbi:MAG: site-specific DNA-methyltransferase [Bdellovibrio sp.]